MGVSPGYLQLQTAANAVRLIITKTPHIQSFYIESGAVQLVNAIFGDDALTLKTGNQSIKIKAGKNVTEAAQSILLKVGASSIKLDPTSITLKSVMIKIQGSAMLDMKAPMTTCKGTAMLTLKGGMTMIN